MFAIKILIIVILSVTAVGAGGYMVSISSHKPELPPIPEGEDIIIDGTFRFAFIEPEGPQEIMQQVFYLESNELDYYLILREGIQTFTNGTNVRVIGTLVIPSSWSGTDKYSFDGDIYVREMIKE